MNKIFLILFFSITSNARPLSVLFVTNKFPYEPRAYVDNQITGFIDAGVEVTILAECDSAYSNYSIAEQYKFKDITFYKYLPPGRRTFDIIYCQFPSLAKKMLIERKNNLISGKIVGCFRAGCEFNNIAKKREKYKKFFEEIDLILVVCKFFKDILVSFGCPEKKILIHQSAIDIGRFDYQERKWSPNEKMKFITVGRLHKMKGHVFLIKAMHKVRYQYPSIEYHIYGTGQEYEELYKLIKEYNLEDTIFLKGYCSHDNIPNILHQYHVFLLSSCTTSNKDYEGIPNVIMEALATGMPVIATKHGGIPELIKDGETGFIVEEQNENKIAEKIIYLIQHPEVANILGNKGRKQVLKMHNKTKQNKKLIDIFSKLEEFNNYKMQLG